MKILLTGFEPFGGSVVNPSEQVVKRIAQDGIRGCLIIPLILPVDQKRGSILAVQAVEENMPDAVVMLGEARGRFGISIERVAVNLLDFSIPDNAGNHVCDQPIETDGQSAYFSTLPVRLLLEAVQKEGIPAELSLSAGAYLCNQVMYSVLHWILRNDAPILAGFIHLPSLPEQIVFEKQKIASMSLETMRTGIEAGINRLVDYWETNRNAQ